jgi:uncharacterized protein YjbJ (UPF0337 family)
MYSELLKGKWNKMKREVKVKWNNLTDEDLSQIDGKEEELLELLQKKYGYSQEKAEEEYNTFIVRFERRHSERKLPPHDY